jgi:hypothetical protein
MSDEVAAKLSRDRMRGYRDACAGDDAQALRLYAWNIAVGSAFWGGFHVMEVSLRNAVHAGLVSIAGRDDWWESDIGLHSSETRRIKDAIAQAGRLKGEQMQVGHVIAELNLGFWTALLANRYHQRLWERGLADAFPMLKGKRRELHRKVESLRKLRNRIAHHEPIHARNLSRDHADLLSVIGAISPEVVRWVELNSRVRGVVSDRDAIVAGEKETTF